MKKQSQFAEDENEHKVNYDKVIREIKWIGYLVKTNPIKANLPIPKGVEQKSLNVFWIIIMIKKANLESITGHIIDDMKENTEQDWVERAGQGEAAAIAELFHLYWRAARAAAYGVTGDFALTEDAASEAFYAVIERACRT